MVFEVADQEFGLMKKKIGKMKKKQKKFFFSDCRYNEFVKNECRYNEIMKFEFKFVISDLENLG